MLIAIIEGLIFGILFSVIPGPTGYGILHYATANNRESALRWLAGLVSAETMVIFALLLVPGLSALLGNYWFEASSGLFLLGFSFVTYLGRNKETLTLQANPLFITLFNPGVWGSLVVMMAIGANFPTSEKVAFLLSLELGTLTWYLIAVFGINHLGSIISTRIKYVALIIIAVFGSYSLIHALYKIVS